MTSVHRDAATQRRLRSEARPPQALWSINVFLVEDDAADTSLILSVLRRHATVASAHASDDPPAALHQLATGRVRPDLVLLDIHMPRMDGFQFLEGLREIPAMAAVPVVFLTTSALGADAVAARQSSASFYLIKPDSYAELQARLDGVIKRAASGAWSK